MEATRPLIQESPRETALDMSNEMLALAERGEWQQLENVAVMLRSAILNVPESERGEVVDAARRAAELVRAKAEDARGDVMSRLKAIRRGQSAARAYGVNTGHHPILKEVRPGT